MILINKIKEKKFIKKEFWLDMMDVANKYIGVLVTLLGIIALELMYPAISNISSVFIILCTLITFSIFKGTLLSILISAIMILSYIIYLHTHYGIDLTAVISDIDMRISAVATIIIVTITGIIKYKYQSYYEKYKTNQICISRAEEISSIMISYVTTEGRFIKVSQKLCDILGYDVVELMGKNVNDITHPEDAKIEEKFINEIIMGERLTYNIDKRILKRNGEFIEVFINVSAVYDDHGAIICLLNYTMDITEKKRMEREVRTQLDFLNKLMDAIPNPIFIKKIDTNNINYNKAFEMFVKDKTKEVKTSDFSEILGEDKIREIKEVSNKAIELNKSLQYNLVVDGLKEYNTASFLINIAPYTNMQGQAAGVIGSITDITHIKKIEEELRRSQNKYKRLIQMSPDTVLINNGDKITFINQSGVNLIGYNSPQEVIGQSIFRFVHEDNMHIAYQQMERTQKNLNVPGLPFELKLALEDGETIDVEVINIGFMDGNNVSIMSVIRDITERKRNEELKKTIEENARLLTEAMEYDKIKNEFFANISHELRTPLNVILGILQLLIIYSDKEAGKFRNMDRYLNMMKQNCYRLLRLVNNLIDITKIDAGFFQMKLRNNDIVRIVEDITLSVADYVEEQGLTLEFDTNMEGKIISCDPDQMERIILNLLSNSIKFTSPGGKISVFLDEADDNIEIRIKDTGIGIPEDKLEYIFERFRQVDKSLTRDHEGSGIGLSLVKSLVEMHEGTISVTSQEDYGTEFTIKIPAKKDIYGDEEETVIEEGAHIERIKVEFSDIYSI